VLTQGWCGVDLALHKKLKYITFNMTKSMLYISIIINVLGKVKVIEMFFNMFIHVYNFQRDKRSVIVHGVRKLCEVRKTSFIYNFLINNERRLKSFACYSR